MQIYAKHVNIWFGLIYSIFFPVGLIASHSNVGNDMCLVMEAIFLYHLSDIVFIYSIVFLIFENKDVQTKMVSL